MNNQFSLETALNEICLSKWVRKIFIGVLIAGITICFFFLLPPVQDFLVNFMLAIINRPVNTFIERLYSLFTLPLIGFMACVFALCCMFSKQISIFIKNNKNEKRIIVISCIIILFVLIFTCIFSYVYGHGWLGGDHSAEMVLGKLLADENRLVTQNWIYSTELRLVYQTFFIMPLFKILGDTDWALVRSITISLNMIVLVVSYVYMTVKMRVRPKWIAITSILLTAPISMEYWDIVIFGGYYVFFMAQVFMCIGAFFALLCPMDEKKSKSKASFCIFSLFSLVLGIQGIRGLMSASVPLSIACITAFFSGQFSGKKKTVFLGVYCLVLSAIGFFINNLLHFKYTFISFDNTKFDNLFSNLLQKLSESLYCVFSFFGLQQDEILFSARGLFGVVAIIFAVALFIFAGRSIGITQSKLPLKSEFQSKLNKNFLGKLISLFFVSSVCFNIFLLVTTNDYVHSRYLIPSLIFYLPVCALLFEVTETHKSALSCTALLSFVVLFVLGQGHLNYSSLLRVDNNTKREGYITYLESNNITFGFATDDAQVTTELTNGKIEEVNLDNGLHLAGMLNKKSHLDPAFFHEKSYLLLSCKEWEQYKNEGVSWTQREPDYEDDFYVILVFPSAKNIYSEVIDYGAY